MRDEAMRDGSQLCEVVYRANGADGAEVTLKLRLAAKAITAADGWARLCEVYGRVDPRSIEIEIRGLVPA